MEDASAAVGRERAIQALRDPEQAEDGEGEGAPVDERAGALVLEDSEERPGDGDAAGKVALGRGERVRRGSRLEEEEREEDEDLGPDAGAVRKGVHAKGLEGGEKDEHSRPAVVEREGEVHPELVVQRLGGVEAPNDVVDVRDGRADEQGEDECCESDWVLVLAAIL